MEYQENVQELCDRLFIPNPIRERDLKIQAVHFFDEETRLTKIEATPMNRAGRLFFQSFITRAEQSRSSNVAGEDLDRLREKAAVFFAENWLDAEEANRPMLKAFKLARAIVVVWQ